MKIKVRIPTDTYAFQEVEFDSLEEYKTELPKFFEAYKELKKKVN